MKFAILFHLFFVCLLSKGALTAFVSDLKPDVDCDALLKSKAAERANDPNLVSDSEQTDLIHCKLRESCFGSMKLS